MCNAWNHPPGCSCGWGGEGSQGGSPGLGIGGIGLPRFTDWARTRYRQESRAFVNPNAKCPVCKTGVFFYQSPEGGRVFFDHLGKPWPKHACFTKSPERFETVQSLVLGVKEIKRSEWMPFICHSVTHAPLVGREIYVLEGLFDDNEIKLFCKQGSLRVRSPFLMKKTDLSGINFTVSSVHFTDSNVQPFEFQASRLATHFLPNQNRNSQKQITENETGRSTKSKQFIKDAKRAKDKYDALQTQKITAEKKPQKTEIIWSAMELAFQKANSQNSS